MLLLTARRQEFQHLVKNLPGHPGNSEPDPFVLVAEQKSLRVSYTGTKPESIASKINQIPKDWIADTTVVFTGTAGALTEDLDKFSLVAANQLIEEKKSKLYSPPDPGTIFQTSGLGEIMTPDVVGPMLTAPEPVLTREDRLNKTSQTGAVAVDMEAAHVYANLVEKVPEVKFVCVKIISDTLEQTTLKDVLELQNPALRKLSAKFQVLPTI